MFGHFDFRVFRNTIYVQIFGIFLKNYLGIWSKMFEKFFSGNSCRNLNKSSVYSTIYLKIPLTFRPERLFEAETTPRSHWIRRARFFLYCCKSACSGVKISIGKKHFFRKFLRNYFVNSVWWFFLKFLKEFYIPVKIYGIFPKQFQLPKNCRSCWSPSIKNYRSNFQRHCRQHSQNNKKRVPKFPMNFRSYCLKNMIK